MTNVVQLNAELNPLTELQKAFGLMKSGGEVRICDLAEIASIRAGDRHALVNMYKQQAGKTLMTRYLETLPVSSKSDHVIGDFLRIPRTKMYNGTAFSPLPTPPAILKFWVNPSVQPEAGDWSVIKDFLHDIICDGNDIAFTYVIRYLAHMLQHPKVKPGVMLVMLGGQGIGKGTMFSLLEAIWNSTTLMVSDVNHVIGQFNAALERNFVVCMDEAIFNGDKKAFDRLKSMVTERAVKIEEKYQPRRNID